MNGFRIRAGLSCLSIMALVVGVFATAAEAKPHHGKSQYSAQVTRTKFGIPHIVARNWGDLGYGTGYAYAEDNICTLANEIVTTRARRSKYFGPNGTTVASAKVADNNLESDFFWQSVKQRNVVGKLRKKRAPVGPRKAVRKLVRGYAAGYNAYLKRTGVKNLSDPRCRGKAWVKPITSRDVFNRAYQLAILASTGQFIEGINSAEPPSTPLSNRSAPSPLKADASEVGQVWRDLTMTGRSLGSNGLAVGSKGTRSGNGIMLANPHFPWIGGERFYQFQQTIPGKVNVQGASLGGVPVVNIGFNRHVAWTHTVSTAWRFTPIKLDLVPGQPTSYVVDGKTYKMTSQKVKVPVRSSSGTTYKTHTFWFSKYGPVVNIPDAFYSWDDTTAYALADANAGNLRLIDQWFAMNQARNVNDLVKAQSNIQGDPWVNTIATDDRGHAMYQDNSVVPNVTAEKIDDCLPAGIPTLVYQQAGIITLDGGRSACDWGTDSDAVVPGIFGRKHLPVIKRRDFVQNSNDSYWLSNPHQPLTGFSPIIGATGTEQGLRTRYGIRMAESRIAGTDGLKGKKFTVSNLRRLWERYDSEAGNLLKDQLADLCRANPIVTLESGETVDVTAACPVLDAWNGNARLDSKGSWLFQVWWYSSGSAFTDSFDPNDPVNTPTQLDPSEANIEGLGVAVKQLRDRGIPLNASTRQVQFVRSHGLKSRKVPVPGCNSGCYSNIYSPIDPVSASKIEGVKVEYGQVVSGSSTVMQIEMTPRGPKGTTLVTYSESENPRSRHHSDQTSALSKGKWLPVTFTRKQIRKQARSSIRIRGKR